ncbi:hypothetical protein, partial [Prochlorothrix hollandica]|uniref:hypothetical protein n=1 Tax=Prochlorothrix hollandica TaxID=1223 RepID=UPI001CEC051E
MLFALTIGDRCASRPLDYPGSVRGFASRDRLVWLVNLLVPARYHWPIAVLHRDGNAAKNIEKSGLGLT